MKDSYTKYYKLITECEYIVEDNNLYEAGEWKVVFRQGKKQRKLVCPPGTKNIGKKCKRMSSGERMRRMKGLRITGRKAKAKMGKILKKRAKSMKKRQRMGI